MFDAYVMYLLSMLVQLWAILGIALVVLDLCLLTGIFFFLGIGAFVTALAVRLDLASGLYIQLGWCFVSAALVGVIFRHGFLGIFRPKKSSPPVSGAGDKTENDE